jgi:hypothetical protein
MQKFYTYIIANGYSGIAVLKANKRRRLSSIATVVNYKAEEAKLATFMPFLDVDREQGEIIWGILSSLSEFKGRRR